MPAYRLSCEQPTFFGVRVTSLNDRDHHTHYPIDNGDILFAMHDSCAVMIQRVHEGKRNALVAQGSLPTLREYYDKLRKECPRDVDEWGNIHWPHEYYGAKEFWGWDDWEYEEGCPVRSFPFDSREDAHSCFSRNT
jgi:hypothetical protein